MKDISLKDEKPQFDDLVRKNVEAIARLEQAAHVSRTRSDVISDTVAKFCGRPLFIYVHCLWFGAWLAINTLPAPFRQYRFDRPPFSILTMIVALEAIFLSSFILMSQTRQQKLADQRNHLDLQVNMLAEQESSQMLTMMKQLMDHVGIKTAVELEALQETTDHERLAEQIERSLEIIGQEPAPES